MTFEWKRLPHVMKINVQGETVFLRDEGEGALLLYSSRSGIATFVDFRFFLGLADWLENATNGFGEPNGYLSVKLRLLGVRLKGRTSPEVVKIIEKKTT